MKFFYATKNKYLTYLIVGSLIFSFTLALSSELYISNNPCSECHRLWYERCTLLPADSNSYLPTTINKNNDNIRLSIEITGSGRNNYYEIDRLSVSLNSANGLLEIDEPKQEYNRLYPGDKKILNWNVRAKENGIDTLEFTLSAYNSHENSQFHDYYSYPVTINTENGTDEKTSAIEPSSWSISIGEHEETLILFVTDTVQNIKLEGPEEIAIQPTYISVASSGEDITITLNANSEKRIEGILNISWTHGTNKEYLSILIIYNPPVKELVDYFSILGRVLGILCFIFLTVSMMLGGIIKRVNAFFAVKIGNRGRIQAHCIISWLLLILSIFHGFILVIRPYNEFFWDPEILLGDISVIFMLIVSINGSFMKTIIKLTGPQMWRWIHRLFSWSAVTTTAIHAILIGTEFSFFREVLGL